MPFTCVLFVSQEIEKCCGLNQWNDTFAGRPCPSFNTTLPCLPAFVADFRESGFTISVVVISAASFQLLAMCLVRVDATCTAFLGSHLGRVLFFSSTPQVVALLIQLRKIKAEQMEHAGILPS